jgi:hypothetical protein
MPVQEKERKEGRKEGRKEPFEIHSKGPNSIPEESNMERELD